LIAHVSAIFLLPVFEKSVIFNDFRAIWHSISARKGGNAVCCNAMFRNKTIDDCVTCWSFWKHLMARRRGLEFGVFDRSDATKMGSSARPYWPRRSIIFPPQNYHSQRASVRPSSFSARLHENTSQMWARPCGPHLSSVANAKGANFFARRCLPRGLGHAALDSDNAMCFFQVLLALYIRKKIEKSFIELRI